MQPPRGETFAVRREVVYWTIALKPGEHWLYAAGDDISAMHADGLPAERPSKRVTSANGGRTCRKATEERRRSVPSPQADYSTVVTVCFTACASTFELNDAVFRVKATGLLGSGPAPHVKQNRGWDQARSDCRARVRLEGDTRRSALRCRLGVSRDGRYLPPSSSRRDAITWKR